MRATSYINPVAGLLDLESSAANLLMGQGATTSRDCPASAPTFFEFAHPSRGGIVSKHPLSGAYRTTGSSSSKKKKTGDHEFLSSDGQ